MRQTGGHEEHKKKEIRRTQGSKGKDDWDPDICNVCKGEGVLDGP